MNATSIKLALGLFALACAPALTGCGTAEEGAALEAAEAAEAPVGKSSAALLTCYGPVRDHARWLSQNPGQGTNFVSADIRSGAARLLIWMDTQRATYTPPLCLPGRPCLPASWSYQISGAEGLSSITVDSAGNMTINGVRVTPTACTATSPTSTVINGTAGGSTYTVTLVNQYLG